MFYCHTARHTTPHTFGGDTGHTHTHADEVAGEICLQPMLNCPTSRAAWSSGQPLWPRRQSQERQSQDLFFCSSACFYVGALCGGNPCEHGENMQTPHKKAREIAHLSTKGLVPSNNSAPCGNRTQDFLAVRRQCKQLSHMYGTYIDTGIKNRNINISIIYFFFLSIDSGIEKDFG